MTIIKAKDYTYHQYKDEAVKDYVTIIEPVDTITRNPEGPHIKEEDFLPKVITFIDDNTMWFDDFITKNKYIVINRGGGGLFVNSEEKYTGPASARIRSIT